VKANPPSWSRLEAFAEPEAGCLLGGTSESTGLALFDILALSSREPVIEEVRAGGLAANLVSALLGTARRREWSLCLPLTFCLCSCRRGPSPGWRGLRRSWRGRLLAKDAFEVRKSTH